MSRTIYLELVAGSRMAIDLNVGGLFVNDKTLALQEQCEIIVFNDGGQLELPARAVYVDGNGGVGLEVIGFSETIKSQLAALLAAGTAAAEMAQGSEPAIEPLDLELASEPAIRGSEPAIRGSEPAIRASEPALDLELELVESTGTAEPAGPTGEAAPEVAVEEDDEESAAHKSLHERLRGMPLAQQIKRAKAGGVTERTLLERLYGKNVWEALLRNPALTAPEVARIARMGAIPRPLLEIILGNGGWLQVPEVRRALLSNPRLGTDQIIKLLRMMSKQELKIAVMQTAYSMAVRSQAKTMLKAEGG